MLVPQYKDSGAICYIGDCAEVLPQLDIQANLIITSPPYGDMRTFGGHTFDFGAVADACCNALAPGGVLVWVVSDPTVKSARTGDGFRHVFGFMERGLTFHDTMIYRMIGGPPHKLFGRRHKNGFQFMFVFCSGQLPKTVNLIQDQPSKQTGMMHGSSRRQPNGSMKKQHASVLGEFHYRDNVWEYSPGYGKMAENPIAHQHPAIFPHKLAQDHIRTWTNPGDLVLDPMAGSGTTLKAAKDLGRTAVGVEIHADYLPIIEKRLAQQVLNMDE